ncbi:MAG: integrase [Acidimicrobiales bacterium]
MSDANDPFGNIRQLKSGRYQARYFHLGKQVPADTTYATKAEARAWLATMETDILGGRHIDPTSGRETFGDYARRWLEARDIRPRTRDTYESQLAHILEEFETVELRKITPADVRAWHGQQAKSKKHPNTVAKIYRLFRTMMETAPDDGLLRVNPVHIKGAAVEHAAERPALDWDDVQKLASVIEPRFGAFVWVAATSGLRFGELTGLTRANVDPEARTLRVDQALIASGGVTPLRYVDTHDSQDLEGS